KWTDRRRFDGRTRPAGSEGRVVGILADLRAALRVRHYSRRTEGVYAGWTKRFARANGLRPLRELGATEVSAFLTQLAVDGHVSPSTQMQALAALSFLYREVLGRDLGRLEGLVPARRPKRLPAVLTRAEVAAVLRMMRGTPALVAGLLYG